MAFRTIDRTGEIHGRLKVICRSPVHARAYWNCICDCGKSTTVRGDHLKEERVQSCGCLVIERMTSHGMARTPTYKCWQAMKDRCSNPLAPEAKNYIERGITVCDRWIESFENFFEDMGLQPQGLTLDRENNDLGYSKENCRWATRKEQVDNRRNTHRVTIDGETMCLKDWCKRLGVCYSTARKRVIRGLSHELALNLL